MRDLGLCCCALLLVCTVGRGWAQPGELTGIWWAHEEFTHPDGRQETWGYLVGLSTDGGQLAIADGDGLLLTCTLAGDRCTLRGKYPWPDGRRGHYLLQMQVAAADLLEAHGPWADSSAAGVPIPAAHGTVRIVFVRAD